MPSSCDDVGGDARVGGATSDVGGVFSGEVDGATKEVGGGTGDVDGVTQAMGVAMEDVGGDSDAGEVGGATGRDEGGEGKANNERVEEEVADITLRSKGSRVSLIAKIVSLKPEVCCYCTGEGLDYGCWVSSSVTEENLEV